MGLSPRQIGQYPDRLVDLYAKVERDIISDMAKRIAEKDMFIPSAQWQFEKLQEMGMVQSEIVGRLSAVSGKSKDEIRRIITESGYKALNNDAKIYKRAGIDPTEALQSQSVKQALDNGLRMTNGEFENITRTTVNNATMQYFDALDSAYLQVSSGAFDHNTAIRNAIQKLTDNGIAVANYAGHNDYMETAVRRSILTGVNQAAAKGQEALADELDCDLVEVTAHSGARTGKGIANHAAWQGKIYSRSGKSTKYPSLVEKTGYGSGAGLCGWNCRHSFYPYIEGSERAYTDDELKSLNEPKYEYNGERLSEYEATQKQRYIERQIRKYKREVAGFESAGLDTANSKSKLRNWQDRQRDFIEQTGLKRDYEREQIGKLHKTVAKGENSGIIKLQINLFDKSDALYFDALSIEEENGFEDVCLHGSPSSVQMKTSKGVKNYTPKEFSDYLKNSTSYNGGNIRLASCSTGKGDNSFAQQLSRELGVTVKAPDDDVYYIPDSGVVFVGSPYRNIGKWRIFRNGDEIFD